VLSYVCKSMNGTVSNMWGKETGGKNGSKKRNENKCHHKITARASTAVAFIIEPNETENNQVFELFSLQHNDSCVM